jgi:hypothetical protein
LEALWIYGSNADPAVLSSIISKRDENWESSQLNLKHYDNNHPLRYIYHNRYFPLITVDEENLEKRIAISSLNHEQKKLIVYLTEREDNSQELEFEVFFETSPTAPVTWKQGKYPPSVNFSDFPNNEHTQFVGTTPMDNQEVENLWHKIVVTPLEEYVLKGLHLFDDKIQKVGLIVKPNSNIPMIFIEKERIPLKHLGEGMFRVFHIILALVNAKEGFLLIDEFENGLHYTVQPKVWEFIFKLAKELNVQVFVTTHSWDCVTAFAETTQQNETEGMLFHLGRSGLTSDEGKIIATAYDKEELELATFANLEVR